MCIYGKGLSVEGWQVGVGMGGRKVPAGCQECWSPREKGEG